MQYARHPSRCLRWMMKKKKICLYGNYILLNLISGANSYTTLKYITCRQDAYITFICHLLNSRYQDNQNIKLKVIFNLPMIRRFFPCMCMCLSQQNGIQGSVEMSSWNRLSFSQQIMVNSKFRNGAGGCVHEILLICFW